MFVLPMCFTLAFPYFKSESLVQSREKQLMACLGSASLLHFVFALLFEQAHLSVYYLWMLCLIGFGFVDIQVKTFSFRSKYEFFLMNRFLDEVACQSVFRPDSTVLDVLYAFGSAFRFRLRLWLSGSCSSGSFVDFDATQIVIFSFFVLYLFLICAHYFIKFNFTKTRCFCYFPCARV